MKRKDVKIAITDNREVWREKHNFYKFFCGLKEFGKGIMNASKKFDQNAPNNRP